MHLLPDARLIEAVHQRFGGVPREVLEDGNLAELFIPTLRADFALVETYRYADDVPLGCPIIAFGGTEDSQVAPADLSAWRKHTSRSFSMRMFPGGHFYLKRSGREVIRAVSRQLAHIRADIHDQR
jgi:surfactin synthase thioesterase subunit